MRPAVSILQLDTQFPRVPGDVACPDTYIDPVEILRVPHATVGQIVSTRPDQIDIAPFEAALRAAKGEVIVTSCGFLSYWQAHLSRHTDRPFISSALTALDVLSQHHDPGDVLIVTFDADSLTTAHLGDHAAFATGIVGLPKGAHLRQVISQNKTALDVDCAGAEIAEYVRAQLRPHHKHILLECTNLPPYRAALEAATGLPISDILTQIEAARPGTIQPHFLPKGSPQ